MNKVRELVLKIVFAPEKFDSFLEIISQKYFFYFSFFWEWQWREGQVLWSGLVYL